MRPIEDRARFWIQIPRLRSGAPKPANDFRLLIVERAPTIPHGNLNDSCALFATMQVRPSHSESTTPEPSRKDSAGLFERSPESLRFAEWHQPASAICSVNRSSFLKFFISASIRRAFEERLKVRRFADNRRIRPAAGLGRLHLFHYDYDHTNSLPV